MTTPTPRHPLVDAWTEAGLLVDATFHALYDGTCYATPYTSFAIVSIAFLTMAGVMTALVRL